MTYDVNSGNSTQNNPITRSNFKSTNKISLIQTTLYDQPRHNVQPKINIINTTVLQEYTQYLKPIS